VTLTGRRRLSGNCVEISLSRPPEFGFTPGQTLCIVSGAVERHYSMISTPEDDEIRLCVRHIPHGTLSPMLTETAIGTSYTITGPHGYFTFRPSGRSPVFVATGSGIAPFVSMFRSGTRPFALLHGVRRRQDLYYRSLFRPLAGAYVACLSQANDDRVPEPDVYSGRVTAYLKHRLPPGIYDFYLCGSQEMVRDATLTADDRFAGSRVFTEIFFSSR
jgi:ferredoxin-NADP reductase